MITTVPTYFVQSGNWTKIVRATDPMEAATVAIEQVYNSADSKTYKVGVVTLIWDVKDKRDNNLDKQLYLYTPAVLANAGFHDIAKKLDDYANGVIKGMTDKNKSEDVE